MLIITNRCLEILKILLKQETPITVIEISRCINVSERTIRYDLKLLKSWLDERGICLMNMPRKGIFLEDKAAVYKLLKNYDDSVTGKELYLTSEERKEIMKEILILSTEGVKISSIEKRLFVCKSTVIKDMKQVEEWFAEKGIRLLRKKKNGLLLDTTEANLRNTAVGILTDNIDEALLLRKGSHADLQFLNLEKRSIILKAISNVIDLNQVLQVLDQILVHLDIILLGTSFIEIFYYIAFSLFRMSQGYFNTVENEYLDGITQCVEYKYIKEVFYPLIMNYTAFSSTIDHEIAFIVIHIICAAKIRSNINFEYENEITDYVLGRLDSAVKDNMHISITRDEKLVENLRRHLKTAIIRARFHIVQVNPLLADIRRSYRNTFLFCKEAVKAIESKYFFSFDDHEIGYITMYIETAVRKMCEPGSQFITNAALICGQGVAAVGLIETILFREFPNIKIVSKLSVMEIRNYDFSDVDFILTTINIPFPLSKPVIKVNPVLNKLDIRRIDSILCESGAAKGNDTNLIDDIIEIINENCYVYNKEKMLEDIRGLIKVNKPKDGYVKKYRPSLTEILPQKNFQAHVKVSNWEEALLKSAEPLLANHVMKQEYIDDIIQTKNDYEQYSIIAPGICLPHGAPRPGNKLGMSLITLDTPIYINIDQISVSISVMMTLSVVDAQEHLRALNELLYLIEDNSDFYKILTCCENTCELIKVFYAYYNSFFNSKG